jgi:hypothetical protein
MFDPMLVPHIPPPVESAKARYEELLRRAEAARRLSAAGPAEAKRPRLGLASVLQALRLAPR